MDVEGTLEGLQPYAIHGARYYRLFYSHLDDPETILQCQLPEEALAPGLTPGDPVTITFLLKSVVLVARRMAPDQTM